MKRKPLLPLILFVTFSIHSFAQSDFEATKEFLIDKISTRVNDTRWIAGSSDSSISFMFTDTMSFNTQLSPVFRPPKEFYTVMVTIQFKEGWTEQRIKKKKKENLKIINPLAKKFLHYCDSIKWYGIKNNPEMFNEERVFHLKHWYKLNETERASLDKVVRLPDVLYNDVAVFVDVSYDYVNTFITEKEIHNRVKALLEMISFDVLGSERMLDGGERWE